MSKPLPRPVRELVGDALDDAAIDQGFRAIARRRAPRRAPARQRIVLVAIAAALACIALLLVFRSPAAAGALARADGSPFESLEASVDAAAAHADLADGSSVEVAPGGRVVTMGNDGARFLAMLERGRATVHVQKGGPRAWTFECGFATVEVVGTRFVLDRSADALRVEVREGVVLVRGENVPDRVRRLVGGESITVQGPGAPPHASAASPTPTVPFAAPTAPASAAPLPAASSSSSAAVEPSSAAAEPSRGWRDLAKAGDFRKAYDALGSGGVRAATSSSSVEDLFVLADVARLSGHPGEAVAPLERIVAEHGGDGRAALAALTLARLRLDSLGQPGRAANDFETALALGLPGSLQEDAMGRAVEARFRAGDRDGGKRVGERYLGRFPSGRHAEAVRKLMEATP